MWAAGPVGPLPVWDDQGSQRKTNNLKKLKIKHLTRMHAFVNILSIYLHIYFLNVCVQQIVNKQDANITDLILAFFATATTVNVIGNHGNWRLKEKDPSRSYFFTIN